MSFMNDALASAIAGSLTDEIFRSKPNETRKPASAERLRSLGESYLIANSYNPGELLQWKEGLKDAKWPDYSEPVVVLEVAPGRRSSGTDSDNHHNEPADIRVGVLHNESKHGQMLYGYWMDSNRFEPYTEPAAAAAPVDTADGTPMTEQPQPMDAPVPDQADATE